MRVVVGKKDTPTPIFNDEMTYLVFTPVLERAARHRARTRRCRKRCRTRPSSQRTQHGSRRHERQRRSIRRRSTWPTPSKYRFRQRPGARNSLGLVKFMFPNQFNVYLHDTPADSLFARASRSFSHGCVRLEQPDSARRIRARAISRSGRGSGSARRCTAPRRTTVKLKCGAAGVSRLLDGAGLGRRRPAVPRRLYGIDGAAVDAAGRSAVDKLKTAGGRGQRQQAAAASQSAMVRAVQSEPIVASSRSRSTGFDSQALASIAGISSLRRPRSRR